VINYVLGVFPSMTGRELLAMLKRQPLAYRVVRQKGSHRRLQSENGYPPLTLSFHETKVVSPRAVKKVLVTMSGSEKMKLSN